MEMQILQFPCTIDAIDLNYLNVLRLFYRQNEIECWTSLEIIAF